MVEELTRFKKRERTGISISVDKDNLNKFKKFLGEYYPGLPLSIPFDGWLTRFVETEMIKLKEQLDEEREKEIEEHVHEKNREKEPAKKEGEQTR